MLGNLRWFLEFLFASESQIIYIFDIIQNYIDKFGRTMKHFFLYSLPHIQDCENSLNLTGFLFVDRRNDDSKE